MESNSHVTITASKRGAIDEHSIENLNNLIVLNPTIKHLMKIIHQNAINYLAYLSLDK